MHSAVPSVGKVSSSSQLIPTNFGRRPTMPICPTYVGYLTDCPQREKKKWLDRRRTYRYRNGVFTLLTESPFMKKWLADHSDEQQSNGCFFHYSIKWLGISMGNGLDWTSLPSYLEYLTCFMEIVLLADCYDNIKRYLVTTSPKSALSIIESDWATGSRKILNPKQLSRSTINVDLQHSGEDGKII